VVGAIKPEEKIYRAALDAAQCPPQDCFYIDDIPAYVAAAQSMGIPSHTFTNLRELLNAQKTYQEKVTT
jgi:putative hydrolase of the HAD superfamily